MFCKVVLILILFCTLSTVTYATTQQQHHLTLDTLLQQTNGNKTLSQTKQYNDVTTLTYITPWHQNGYQYTIDYYNKFL